MKSVNHNITKYLLALGTVILFVASTSWAADDTDQSDIGKRIEASANVLNEIMATPDKAIPDKVILKNHNVLWICFRIGRPDFITSIGSIWIPILKNTIKIYLK